MKTRTDQGVADDEAQAVPETAAQAETEEPEMRFLGDWPPRLETKMP